MAFSGTQMDSWKAEPRALKSRRRRMGYQLHLKSVDVRLAGYNAVSKMGHKLGIGCGGGAATENNAQERAELLWVLEAESDEEE
jgi:hypothetical protein